MERNKKRSVSKNIVKGLVTKLNDMIDDKSKIKEVERIMKTIEAKMSSIDKLNEELLDSVEEDQMETEMEEATLFEIEIMKQLDIFKEKLDTEVKLEPSYDSPRPTKTDDIPRDGTEVVRKVENDIPVSKSDDRNSSSEDHSGINGGASSRYNVKLPKIEIKKFYGDPVQWQQFYDIFNATITENKS